MAKIIYRQEGEPPVKTKYIPASRKYKRYFLASFVLNIILLLTTVIVSLSQ